jgi:hypothetical protein
MTARQDDAEGLEIRPALGARLLDQPHELERGVRQCGILEEQARRQARRRRHPGGIDIEIRDARQEARFLPLVVRVAGRHERQLSPHIAQPRSRQALHERVAIASQALVADGEKMERRAKADFQSFPPRCLHDLGRDAAPRHRAAPHDTGRMDLHRLSDRVDLHPLGIHQHVGLLWLANREAVATNDTDNTSVWLIP